MRLKFADLQPARGCATLFSHDVIVFMQIEVGPWGFPFHGSINTVTLLLAKQYIATKES